MANLQSIKKSLNLDEEMLTRYEFSQKLEQLEQSDSKLNQIIVEIVGLLAEAKKELETTDMEAINKLVAAVDEQVIDPAKLEFQQLKRYCSLMGIEAKGKKREDLLKELNERFY
jgi:hypothetical protein